MRRGNRVRKPRGASRVGERFEVEVGAIAHGGHAIARVPTGAPLADLADPPETRVVFVRHAIPGERVLLEITEGTDGDRFWRADAVEVLSASEDRVPAPCPYAGPGLCGGCDFQHVSLERQRSLKADVVREQLSRLARLDVDVRVEAVAGDDHGLRWRTRQRYVDLPGGRRGMRQHRSHDVVEVDECLIAHPQAREQGQGARGVTLVEQVGPHRFDVDVDGFWQVHPGAPSTLVGAVLEALAPRPGDRVLDLYAGVGLFARFLADVVGADGQVEAVEGDRLAAEHAATNLAEVAGARVVCAAVGEHLTASAGQEVDLVVLDPPREGAKRLVVEQIVARSPRAVAYVACDPSALARDVAIFAEHGYDLVGLRAFDLFPMTHHVECVATLAPRGPEA